MVNENFSDTTNGSSQSNDSYNAMLVDAIFQRLNSEEYNFLKDIDLDVLSSQSPNQNEERTTPPSDSIDEEVVENIHNEEQDYAHVRSQNLLQGIQRNSRNEARHQVVLQLRPPLDGTAQINEANMTQQPNFNIPESSKIIDPEIPQNQQPVQATSVSTIQHQDDLITVQPQKYGYRFRYGF